MKYFVFLLVFVAVSLPLYTFAALDQAPPDQIVTCENGGACDYCNLIQTISNTTQWITAIALLIGAILFMYAGYRITAARGDVGVVTEARKMMGNVAIGIFILVLAFSIVDIIVKTTTGDSYGIWNKVEKCGFQVGKDDPAPTYRPEGLQTGQGVVVSEPEKDTTTVGPQ